MKKTICTALALVFGAVMLVAQTKHSNEGRFYAGIKEGVLLNIYENAFSYRDNDKTGDLFTMQTGVFAGYDLNDIFGVRLSVGYANNAGACNVRETAGGGFWPYTFSSINVFADAIMDIHGLSDLMSVFRCKLYGGLGFGHTYGFTDAHHPWQKVTDPNTVFGFRFGAIAEYNVTDHIGLIADLSGEAYTDKYNGLMPKPEEQRWYDGYGGFPMDLRGIIFLGVLYRF